MKQKMIIIINSFLILFLMLCFSNICFAEDSIIQKPVLQSEASLLIDMDSGQILYSNNMHQKLYPASTTKILTALIALEKCSLSDTVIIGTKPPYEEGTIIYLFEDEQLTVKDLMYAMLLESANDAADALAEHISGSTEEFAKLMNKRARELGCKDSNFVNPNGLFDENHYTSAYDLAIIAKEAMNNNIFSQIVSTLEYQILPTNKQSEIRYINNHNKLLNYSRYEYEGTDGVKNGYTTKSNSTLVASCVRDRLHLMAVFLNCQYSVYEDAIAMFDYGFKAYSNEDILSTNKSVSTVFLKDSDDCLELYPSKNLSVAVASGTVPEISQKVFLTSDLSHINAGDEVGYMRVTINNESTYTVPLVSQSDHIAVYANVKHSTDPITYYRKWIILGCMLLTTAIAAIIIIHKRRRLN